MKIYEKLVESEIINENLLMQHKPNVRLLEVVMYNKFEEFQKTFSKEQEEILTEYFMEIERYLYAATKEAFNKGYALGAKMTAEAFIDADGYIIKE